MKLPKFTLGVGDRFGAEGEAQLDALIRARDSDGVAISPVWNKSNREHRIIGTSPRSTREAADAAVRARGWVDPYFVDADHITAGNVDPFLDHADFFTLDVADAIGQAPPREGLDGFLRRRRDLAGRPIRVEGIEEPLRFSKEGLEAFGGQYLTAIGRAAETYRLIEDRKGKGRFVTEVSMDETDRPQTPGELLLILAELAHEGVPVQTLAPRFSGAFHKGVDYVGDVAGFAREFAEDVAVAGHAVRAFGLPEGLKLSIHSGSDKFSLYGPIRQVLRESGAGVHLKTAGTTWLEEVIGLAEAGGEGLRVAKDIYRSSFERVRELSEPYAAVIHIGRDRLPLPEAVDGWDAESFASALRHDPDHPAYDRNLRQLVHIGFRVAAEMGERFQEALREHREPVARNVTRNLYERHIRPLFLEA